MGVCVVENLSRVFLSKWPLILLWVMRVYIVWMKGKKVTFKKSFRQRVSRVSPSCETLVKLIAWCDFSVSSMCFSRAFFTRTFLTNFLRANRKTALVLISCLILYQLNTKPNTIKSHKIQGNKLMQLQHFLSWNKANIKHNCKSQPQLLHGSFA